MIKGLQKGPSLTGHKTWKKSLNLFSGKTHPIFLTGVIASNKRCYYIVWKNVCVCVCVFEHVYSNMFVHV